MKKLDIVFFLILVAILGYYLMEKETSKLIIRYPEKETLHDEQSIFTQNVSKLIDFVYEQGYQCTFGEAWRSKEQAALYAKEGKGIKDSLHCERLAIDLNLFNGHGKYIKSFDDYEHIGTYWESLHPDNEWGGRWRPSKQHPHQAVDMDHFEMKLDIK